MEPLSFGSLAETDVVRRFPTSARYSHSANEATLYMYRGMGSLGSIAGGSRVLVLRECIWNATAVPLFLSALDETGSLGSPPRQVFYPPASMVPP